MKEPKCRTCHEHHWGLCPVAARAAARPPAKLGRPLAKDVGKTHTATKPWEAEGMSRATWYARRQAEVAKLEATAARLERTGRSRMKRASAKKRG